MLKVKIELTPHDAIVLASFHQEFMEDLNEEQNCESLKIAMNSFLDQVCVNMPAGGMDDANAELEVNILLGKAPNRPNL